LPITRNAIASSHLDDRQDDTRAIMFIYLPYFRSQLLLSDARPIAPTAKRNQRSAVVFSFSFSFQLLG
jgi:hypothetical protein